MPIVVLDQPKTQQFDFVQAKKEVHSTLQVALETLPVILFNKILGVDRVNNYNPSPNIFKNQLLLLIFSIFFVTSSFFSEPLQIFYRELWIWPTMFINSIVYIIAARQIIYNIVEYCVDQFEENTLVNFTKYIKNVYSFKRKLRFSIWFTVLLTLPLVISFYYATGVFTFASYIAAFVVSFFIASWIYGAAIMIFYTRFLVMSTTKLDIYPLDPANSVIIKRSENVIKTIGYAIATIIAFYIPGPVISGGTSGAYFYVGVVLIVFVAVVLFFLFFASNFRLQEIVNAQKHIITSAIQREVKTLIDKGNISNKEIKERFDYLVSLHEKIATSKEQRAFLASISQLFNSILIPIGSFLISNYSTIWAFIQQFI